MTREEIDRAIQDAAESLSCPLCGGECAVLGILGWLLHFRCQCCGCADSVNIKR